MIRGGGLHVASGCKGVVVARPAAGLQLNVGLDEDLAGVVADKGCGHGPGVLVTHFRVERTGVSGVRAHGYAPVARVADASLVPRGSRGDDELDAVRKRCARPIVAWTAWIADAIGSLRVSVTDQVPSFYTVPTRSESAVVYHLRIETSLVGVVNFFCHEAVEHWAYRSDDGVRVDGKPDCLSSGRGEEAAQEGQKQ